MDGYMTIKQVIEALQEIARLYGDDIPVVRDSYKPVVAVERTRVNGANGCVLK